MLLTTCGERRTRGMREVRAEDFDFGADFPRGGMFSGGGGGIELEVGLRSGRVWNNYYRRTRLQAAVTTAAASSKRQAVAGELLEGQGLALPVSSTVPRLSRQNVVLLVGRGRRSRLIGIIVCTRCPIPCLCLD